MQPWSRSRLAAAELQFRYKGVGFAASGSMPTAGDVMYLESGEQAACFHTSKGLIPQLQHCAENSLACASRRGSNLHRKLGKRSKIS